MPTPYIPPDTVVALVEVERAMDAMCGNFTYQGQYDCFKEQVISHLLNLADGREHNAKESN